jgi:hypothetical protein
MVLCNKGYRSLENTYSAHVLQKIMDFEGLLEINPFDTWKEIEKKIKCLNPKNYIAQKTKIARKVAEIMNPIECREHPIIKEVSRWINEL